MSVRGLQQAETDEWYTPPEIFDALRMEFDLDPCSPGPQHWVPAERVYTKADDGLTKPWLGSVFVNPPFGKRHGQVPWLKKFLSHGNGIAIVRAYTSADWFHDVATLADAMLFPRGKTKFVRPDGSRGTSPSTGVVMLAMGWPATERLRQSGLGIFINDWTANG